MADIDTWINDLSDSFSDFVSGLDTDEITELRDDLSDFVSGLDTDEITELRDDLSDFVSGLDTDEITELRDDLSDFISGLDTDEITELRDDLSDFISGLDTDEITELRDSFSDFVSGLDTDEITELRDSLNYLFDNVGDRNINFGTLSKDELNILDDSVTVFALDGDDLVNASHSSGDNLLYGNSGNDTLIGSFGDRLVGGDGNDVLFAGASANILEGGEGKDQFWIVDGEVPHSAHQITDFDLNNDVIGISDSELNFEDLAFIQTGNNTLIRGSGVDLAIVEGIEPSEFNSDRFFFT
ncbi:hypothetical protein IQ238_17370 [Pleurocapsales cyanobacterium LEGE 06147]|nr:hypothetical protein [Pleurocapsales cyanobacterium LEGE 06147]